MSSSAGVIARERVLTVGDRKRASRKRAVGTREHIVAYLAETQELFDPGGMASTRLATAVGYPGSSVAFAQLLSGMERSGLIEREVRGKRTYRIGLGPSAADAADAAAADADAAAGADELGPDGFDYDELARRLLAQVVRRLAGGEVAGRSEAGPSQAGPLQAGSAEPDAGPSESAVLRESAALRETVAGLEHELASAWTKHGKLAEENARLRERLRAAEQSLALARESLRRLPIAADLDSAEVMLLQRLLASPGEAAGREEARSLRG
jgi:hypothetical protein